MSDDLNWDRVRAYMQHLRGVLAALDQTPVQWVENPTGPMAINLGGEPTVYYDIPGLTEAEKGQARMELAKERVAEANNNQATFDEFERDLGTDH